MPGENRSLVLAVLFLLLALLALVSCGTPQPSPTTVHTASPSTSLTPSVTLSNPPVSTRNPIPSATYDPSHPWGSYPTPRYTPITPIPPPLGGLKLDPE